MEMKEKVLLYFKENFKIKKYYIAQDIASIFNIKRSVASHYLNRLVDEGVLIKEETRPVRFYLSNEGINNKSNVFSDFIGYEGTIKSQIEKCKAAVTYPPNGLSLIIRGNSGVGKSYLANLIYKYAVSKKVIKEDAPFVVLNCADYANNSELLSAALFGYVKGAFTGANSEKRGLLDDADGGYLFLDEIHNLSSENQEKLFILIDSHKFRRLGESDKWINANVRLILATTEDTKNALLATFRRRIPLEITIPDFSTRSYNERMDIVFSFFREEAKKMNRLLKVESKIIDLLVDSKFEGNIGEIKSKIKVLCAQAYNIQSSEELYIEKESVLKEDKNKKYYYTISYKEDNKKELIEWVFNKKQLTRLEGLTFQKLREEVNTYIEDINKSILEKYRSLDRFYSLDKVNYFYTFCLEKINHILSNYGCQLSDIELVDVFKIIASILFNIQVEYLNFEITQREKKNCYKYFSLSNKILKELLGEEQDDFKLIIEPILAAYLSNKINLTAEINALILMHGAQNASSIAYIANNLSGDYIYEPFDMPMNVGNDDLIQQVNSYVEKINTSEGLVVLVDMGSLQRMYDKVKGNVDGDLIIMDNVSTALALDVALKLKCKRNLTQIMEMDLKKFQVSMQFYEGISRKVNIIVSCISGEGIAIKVKEIISKYIDDDNIDIITMNYNELDEKLKQKEGSIFKNTVAVLTTSSLSSTLVPLTNIEEVFSGTADLSNLSTIMTKENMKNCTNEIVKLFTLEGASERLRFLNPEKVIVEVEKIIQSYERYFNIEVKNFLRMNLFLHISTMIERIMIGDYVEEITYTNDTMDKYELEKFIKISNDIFKEVIDKYRIKVPKGEHILIYQILNQIIDN
ncbi:sigma 54-interacting transcriptional regulator [Clostridium nigeriense]|uniref:sigma 54-interacting transcriptional regulator n=1 Tax=Clostridium nigeriense TaxID=1805470 RepID=UPI003D3510DD